MVKTREYDIADANGHIWLAVRINSQEQALRCQNCRYVWHSGDRIPLFACDHPVRKR